MEIIPRICIEDFCKKKIYGCVIDGEKNHCNECPLLFCILANNPCVSRIEDATHGICKPCLTERIKKKRRK